MKKLLLIILFFTSHSSFSQITWSAGMNIAASSYGNMHPRIVTDASGNPLVIWGRMSDESVFISRWNGTGFTMPLNVNQMWLTVATASWMGPDIAAKGDTLYIVMKRTPEGSDTNHIYIVSSFDGGMTFSTPSQVDFIADSISRFPTVTIDDTGNPIVGFMKFNSSFADARWVVARSGDFGTTFSIDVKASGWSGAGALVCDCCPGAITSSGNTVAMLYRDNLSNIRDTWAGISTDGGNNFTAGMGVDQGNWMIMSCPASGPDGVIIGDTLYTTFMSAAGGTGLVYYNKSSLSSMAGSAGIALTGTFMGLTSQNFPRIASFGNALAVVWKQYVSGADQLALRFTNDITTGLPVTVSMVDMNNVTNTDVALTDGNIFVVWQDDNSGTVKYRAGTFASSTGIHETNHENLFSVAPNPVSDFFDIRLSSGTATTISVTDLLGQQIFSEHISNSNLRVNTSEWNAGIYFVALRTGNSVTTQKVIICR